MAIAELRLQYYEDALTSVEIELLQDSLHDRYEQELLRERLPPARRAEGERTSWLAWSGAIGRCWCGAGRCSST